MNPEDFILRNDNIRNNSSPLPSVSGVSRHEAQYSRVEVSRVTVFQLYWIPGSGAEVQKTLAIRKSSKDVNPPPGLPDHRAPPGRADYTLPLASHALTLIPRIVKTLDIPVITQRETFNQY